MALAYIDMYPQLKFSEVYGEKVDTTYISFSTDEKIKEIVSNYELKNLNIVNGKGSFEIRIKKLIDLSHDVEFKKGLRCETYGIIIKEDAVELYCDTERGLAYSLITLNDLIRYNCLYRNSIVIDYPNMRIRGIIEGFYGKPWSLQKRLEAVCTISKHKMNTYIYAPKNDEYHREKWNELYPEESLRDIRNLFRHCTKFNMDFYYTVSPGLSIKYSDESDYNILVKKYKQLFDLGIRKFGILFDDIPVKLIGENDRNMFRDSAEAHTYIVNKLYKYLKDLDRNCSFIVCPTVYYGKGDEHYITSLGKGIPNEVMIFWTGRAICSQELDTRDAQYFLENTNHKPLFWDNYPVNDANMRYEMHLGPIIGRDKNLYEYSEGLVCNVMEQKEASMIPVITICDYLWNSMNYCSERSVDKAIREVVGEGDFECFKKFNNYCIKSCLIQLSNEEFMEIVVKLRLALSSGTLLDILDELQAYFRSNLEASDRLKNKMRNRKLLHEICKWLNKYRDFNDICLRTINCAKDAITGRRISAAAKFVKILALANRFEKNPIQMMNFEMKLLMDTLKQYAKEIKLGGS